MWKNTLGNHTQLSKHVLYEWSHFIRARVGSRSLSVMSGSSCQTMSFFDIGDPTGFNTFSMLSTHLILNPLVGYPRQDYNSPQSSMKKNEVWDISFPNLSLPHPLQEALRLCLHKVRGSFYKLKLEIKIMEFVYNWMDRKLLRKVKHLSAKAKERIWVVSPYVGNNCFEVFDEKIRSMGDVRFVIDFNRRNVAIGATDPRGVAQLAEVGNVRSLQLSDNLHAKVFIFDNRAIVGSPNLSLKALGSNIEAAVVIENGDLVKRIVAFFEKIWEAAKPVEPSEIKDMEEYWKESRPLRENYNLPLFETARLKIGKTEGWSTPVVPSGDDRHILINHNWNPHGYERPCTNQERQSDVQETCCHESKKCYEGRNADWRLGCASAYLFKDYEYATSRRAIKKRRLAFFIAKNPNIDSQYYVCGFLYMMSDKPKYDKPDWWGRQRVYFFQGSRNKSVKLPDRGKNIVKFNRALVSKLPSLDIDFTRKPERYDDAGYIGISTRKNPRYISKEDAVTLLKECFRRTKDRRIARILTDDFALKRF